MLNRFRLLLLFTIVAIGVVGSANAQQAKRQFEKWDKDGDGKLVKDELPQNFRKNFDRVDADKDGVIVLEEHQNFLKQRRNRNRNKKPNQKQVKLPDGIDRVHKDETCCERFRRRQYQLSPEPGRDLPGTNRRLQSCDSMVARKRVDLRNRPGPYRCLGFIRRRAFGCSK